MRATKATLQAANKIYKQFDQLEVDLLELIAKQFPVDTQLDAAQLIPWYSRQIEKSGEIKQAAYARVRQLTGTPSQPASKIIHSIGQSVLASSESTMKDAYNKGFLPKQPPPLKYSSEIQDIYDQYENGLIDDLSLLEDYAVNDTYSKYIETTNSTYLWLAAAAGAVTFISASRRALDKTAGSGIKGGKGGTIGAVARDIVMGRSTRLSGRLILERGRDWGVVLYEVSSHTTARPSHAEWQGGIYADGGKHDKYDDFEQTTGYGSELGLHGIHCYHDFWEYIEGYSKQTQFPYPKETTDRAYKDSQVQGRYERRAQELDRQAKTAASRGDVAGAEQARAKHKAQVEKTEAFCREKGLEIRWDRL